VTPFFDDDRNNCAPDAYIPLSGSQPGRSAARAGRSTTSAPVSAAPNTLPTFSGRTASAAYSAGV